MAGRKSKLTKELIKEAEKLIKLGNFARNVCKYLNIDESTWYRWLREGKNSSENSLKYQFYHTIKKAEAIVEIRHLNIIQNAAKKNWHAAAWFLERRYPDKWGKKRRVEHFVEDHRSIQYESAKKKLLDKIEKINIKKQEKQ